ncbi:hypothetical protein A5724_15970 [Mycobacterium sp. ACS1612]|uniref:hypothetical protein n=1 Tax=Mycobacterium sp. ACS1612 TaxID=1834117 RepID=UPI0008003A2C|nr:hypothetical protein [Mycobacterium sp. ACS1612]OBF34990.1 hypothetical protein A5724_15970 [Mycobacterium sp. ACS1612]
MNKHLRTLILGVSALLALGALTACSGGTSTEATNTSEAVTTPPEATAKPFPQSARYVADMKAADGKTMTIGISVDGPSIAAYACNGTDDEAWFFGNQADGKLDLKSRFRDTLSAQFNGADVMGDLTMNGVAYKFSAAPVSGVAGMYTADSEGVRASWVVREDGSAIGVQFNTGSITGRDFEQAELQQLNEQQFRSSVRNKRQLQQASQIQFLQNKSAKSTINGRDVTPTLVNGTFRLG